MKSLFLKTSYILCFYFLSIISTQTIAEEELATPMAQLQVLTHKLSLAAHYKNPELARFYVEESLVLLEDIQETIPEYQNIPVAVFIDRFAKPAYHQMQVILRANNKEFKVEDMAAAMNGIVESCNTCHRASKFGFIKITNSSENPFNQDFSPDL